jgi:hypothetical protein
VRSKLARFAAPSKRLHQAPILIGCLSASVQMEEIPVRSEAERDELLKSLKEAEARAKAGQTTEYDPTTFKDRLIAIYRRSSSSAI